MATARLNWGNEKSWPPDTAEYVFAAKALDAVGVLHFGIAWTGREMQTQLSAAHNQPHIPATFDAASQLSLDIAKSLIRTYCPEIEAPQTVLHEHWSWALQAVERDRAARNRLHEAWETFREHCSWGRLVAAFMHDDGTASELKQDRWNNREQAKKWLLNCRINGGEVYGSHSSHRDYPLFVRRDTLDALVNPLGTSPSATEPAKGHRSKYLRFLLAAADALDVKPDDTRTHKQVSNDVLALARSTGVKEISPAMADKMATILREPEAGKGKDGPRFRKN